MADCGYGLLSLVDIQKIAVFDIRILNMDRNDENLLISKDYSTGKYTVTPIDHGLSLPDTLFVLEEYWMWYSWSPLNKQMCDEIKEYISGIDIEGDIKKMKKVFNIKPFCIKNYRIVNTLLKIGAKHDLSIKEIAAVIIKEDNEFNKKSKLEQCCDIAQDIAKIAFTDHNIGSSSYSDELLKERQVDVPKKKEAEVYDGSPSILFDSMYPSNSLNNVNRARHENIPIDTN